LIFNSQISYSDIRYDHPKKGGGGIGTDRRESGSGLYIKNPQPIKAGGDTIIYIPPLYTTFIKNNLLWHIDLTYGEKIIRKKI